MYAFVDMEDYQKVEITDTSLETEKASENYLNKIWLETSSNTTELEKN